MFPHSNTLLLGASKSQWKKGESMKQSRNVACKRNNWVVADVWEKDVWDFQAKSGSSGSCRLFLRFLGKITVSEMSGKAPGGPRHPSSRHPRPSETSKDSLAD